MADEAPGELETAADISAARQAFLSEPPAILDPSEPPAAPDATAEENAALDELTTPPAGGTAPAADGGAATTPAPPAGTTPPAVDPYERFGGEEAVFNAHQVQEALRTQVGVEALVVQGLQALGYTPAEVKAALDAAKVEQAPAPGAPPAVADPFSGLEDDDVVTVASIRTVLEQVAADAAAQAVAASQQQVAPLAQTIAEQRQSQVRTFTDAALIESLGQVPADPTEAQAYRNRVDSILAQGAQYYDPNQSNDPQHLRAVVTRAKADLDAADEKRFQDYLQTKRKARDSAPPNIGGGAGGEGPLPEPKNMAEARAQARDTGFFS